MAVLGEDGVEHLNDEALLGLRQLADALELLLELRGRAALLGGSGDRFAEQLLDGDAERARKPRRCRDRHAACGRELMGLSLFDLDRERGTMMIRQGKGKKDRMIPIGERAVTFIDRYQHDVRPALVVGRMNATLFLTHTGEPFTPNRLEPRQERLVSPAPPYDGDADARARCRHPLHPGDAWPCRAFDDADLHAGVDQKLKEIYTATHPGKVRAARAAATPEPAIDDVLAGESTADDVLTVLAHSRCG